MTAISRPQLDRSLREGRIAPLYLLIGNETYLRDTAVRDVTEAALSGTLLREFNEASFSLLTDAAGDAIAAAEQMPMMSERRVVKIRNFAKLREADEELLARYAGNPAPSTVAIFIAEELDKRKKLTKALLDACQVVDFPPIKDGEAKSWARNRLQTLKTAVDEQTLSQIIALAGTDVQTLNSELEKLSIAAIEGGRITGEMVEALIGRSRELSNFELGDRLVAGDRRRALETLHRLLADDVPPVMLLGLIASNYRRLALAKELLSRGARDEVFRMVPQFKRDSFLATVQRSRREKLTEGLQKIAAADLALKSSLATPRLQLELLVCELS